VRGAQRIKKLHQFKLVPLCDQLYRTVLFILNKSDNRKPLRNRHSSHPKSNTLHMALKENRNAPVNSLT